MSKWRIPSGKWFIAPWGGGYYAENDAGAIVTGPFPTVAEALDWIEEYEAQQAPIPTASNIVLGMFSASAAALGVTK